MEDSPYNGNRLESRGGGGVGLGGLGGLKLRGWVGGLGWGVGPGGWGRGSWG